MARAIRTKVGRRTYRSKFEARVAAWLKSQKVGLVEYEAIKLNYLLRVRGGWCPNCSFNQVVQRKKYCPDFLVRKKSGVKDVIYEAKGRFTSKDRTKMLAVRDSNPEYRIILVFQADNPLQRGDKRRYSDWCKTNKFEYKVL
jgi:hypothetical protein